MGAQANIFLLSFFDTMLTLVSGLYQNQIWVCPKQRSKLRNCSKLFGNIRKLENLEAHGNYDIKYASTTEQKFNIWTTLALKASEILDRRT